MELAPAEGTERLAPLRKCAHPDCTCTVGEGEHYCSDYCFENMRADSADDEGCNCGHAECTANVGAIAPVSPLTS